MAMMKKSDGSIDYVKLIIALILSFGLFVAGAMTAYFGFVGLFFGQAIVETEVFTDQYKYECNLVNGTPDVDATGKCQSFNRTAELQSYQDYQTNTTALNNLLPLFLAAFGIVFSLLGLVFLFAALKSAGLIGGKKEKKTDSLY